MYKSQGKGVGHRRKLAHEEVVAEEEILSLFAACTPTSDTSSGSPVPHPEKQRMQVDVSLDGVG